MHSSFQEDEFKEIILPFIPKQIKLSDIKYFDEQGKAFLLTPDEVTNIKNALEKEKDSSKRFKKSELDIPSKYSVVKEGGQYYVVYHGSIGEGSYGKVKLAQNVDTGEWEALKVQQTKEDAISENTLLKKAGQSTGFYTNVSRKEVGKEKFSILMPLAPGDELFAFYSNLAHIHRDIPATQFLQIAKNICSEIDALHQKGILHRDIKLDNLIFHPATGKITPIDLGLACEISPNEREVQLHEVVGNKLTMAPESQDGFYSTRSDTYSVGSTLAELAGFYNKNVQLIQSQNSKIKDISLRNEVFEFILKLIDINPDARPTLKEAEYFFDSLQKQFTSSEAAIVTVGILDVDEYAKSGSEAKNKILMALKNFDEVVLVDKTTNRNHTEYLSIQRELGYWDIAAGNRVFAGNNLSNILSEIPAKVDKASLSSIQCYVFVTQNKKTIKTPGDQIKLLRANFPNADNYQNFISLLAFTRFMYQKITIALTESINYFNDKYGEEYNSMNDVINLNKALQSFETAYINGSLSSGLVYNRLTILQETLQDKDASEKIKDTQSSLKNQESKTMTYSRQKRGHREDLRDTVKKFMAAGHADEANNKYKEAINNYTSALNTLGGLDEATMADAHAGRATCYKALGERYGLKILKEYSESAKHYEKALHLDPENENIRIDFVTTLLNCSIVHLNRNKLNKAIEYCNKALEMKESLPDKTLGDIYLVHAYSHEGKKEYAEAISDFNNAIKSYPKEEDAVITDIKNRLIDIEKKAQEASEYQMRASQASQAMFHHKKPHSDRAVESTPKISRNSKNG